MDAYNKNKIVLMLKQQYGIELSAKTLKKLDDYEVKPLHGKAINLFGQQYGDLVCLAPLKSQNAKTRWLSLCLRCQEENLTTPLTNNLRKGISTSCGCKNTDNIRLSCRTVEPYGTVFGFLEYQEDIIINSCLYYKCKCLLCGGEYIGNPRELRIGHVKSCGCAKTSMGEEKIKRILNEHNIAYEQEKTFDSCRFPHSNNLARFDFYINNQYLLEFDGIQHFLQTSKTREDIQAIKERDQYKNEWCKRNHIPLIRIPYTIFNTLNINDLQLETSHYII